MSHLYFSLLSSILATSKWVSQSTLGHSCSITAPGHCDSPATHLPSLESPPLWLFPISPGSHLSAHPAKVWERASPNTPVTVSERKRHPPPSISHSDDKKITAESRVLLLLCRSWPGSWVWGLYFFLSTHNLKLYFKCILNLFQRSILTEGHFSCYFLLS